MNVVKDLMGFQAPPPAPDYTAAAQATAAGNLDAAKYATQANRANQITPYGTLKWTNDGNNNWTQSIDLSDVGQKLLNADNATSLGMSGLQQGALDRVGQTIGGALPSAYDPNQNTNNAAALLDARLLPQQQKDTAAMAAQLANQGITQGSEAYRDATERLDRQQNDARQQNQLQGINLGMSQQGQQYTQGMNNRNVPINELNAIRTGSQVTTPTFGNYAQQATTQGADLLGATSSNYNAQLGQTNANNAFSSGMMNGLFNMGAAKMGAAKSRGG